MKRHNKSDTKIELKIDPSKDQKRDQILDQKMDQILDHILEEIQVQTQTQTETQTETQLKAQSQEAKWNTKRKVNLGRRILNFGITLIVLASIATSIYFIFMKEPQEKDSTYTANIVVGTNQELLVGQITNMNGNEMDFDIVEEASFDMEQTGSGTGERPSGNASRGGKPTGENQEETISGNVTMPEGEIPEGMTMPEGEIPEGMTMPEGGIPEGMTMPEGEMPEGMTISGQDGGSDKDSDITVEEAITIYQSTGETKSLQIPVGTEVVTKLGNTTTFSRLAVGDVVNLLLEKADNGETIVKIWIVG